MPLSNRSSIISNQDVAAATIVVGNDLAVADFQRLEDALINLPVAGGSIALLNSLTMPTAGYTLPNKPVRIFGAGQASVINTGASTSPVFSFAFDNPYSFQSVSIAGTGIAGQRAFRFASGISYSNQIVMYDARVNNLNTIFSVDLADYPVVKTTDCRFYVANLAGSLHWDGPGEWNAENTSNFSVGGTRGGVSGPLLSPPSLYWANSQSYLADGGTIGYSEISRCSFTNGIMTVTSQGTILSSCSFDSGPAIARFVDIVSGGDSVTLTDCSFTTPTSEAIRIESQNCIITDNQGASVTEIGAANNNYYSGNSGFTPAGIIGPNSLVEDYNVRSVSADTLLTAFSRTVLVDASGANRLITLPTASTSKFRKYTIKKTDATANTVTIDAAGAETIDGATTQVMDTQWQSLTIQSNGTAWSVIASFGFGGASASVDPRDIMRFSMIHNVGVTGGG